MAGANLGLYINLAGYLEKVYGLGWKVIAASLFMHMFRIRLQRDSEGWNGRMNGRNADYFLSSKPSLTKRILIQILRLVLIGLFLYITYLGFIWRRFPEPARPPGNSPAEKAPQPTSPGR